MSACNALRCKYALPCIRIGEYAVPLSHDAVTLWKPKLSILLRGAQYFGDRVSFECTITVASPHQILRG